MAADSLATALAARVDSLRASLDAVLVRLEESGSGDPLGIIDRIDAMYSRAFTDALLLFSFVGIIVGIVVPAVIHWLQRSHFKLEVEKIFQRFEEERSHVYTCSWSQ